MLTHANVYINVKQVSAWAPQLIQAGEKVLGALPFFHVFAMTVVMNFGIEKAAEIIIMPRFVLIDALKNIDKLKPTIMPGVPTLFNAIMHAHDLKKYDLSSLKFCLSGGAPLPLEVRNGFEKLTGPGSDGTHTGGMPCPVPVGSPASNHCASVALWIFSPS